MSVVVCKFGSGASLVELFGDVGPSCVFVFGWTGCRWVEARVRALTRRGAGGGPTVIRHGPLSFVQVGRIAYLNEHMIDLSARELGLLEVLLKRSGRLVSKEQLVDHLCEWGEEVSNNAIEVYVHRLRKKIESGGVRIATVRGLGYCLEKFASAQNSEAGAA